jgi:riboflavin synthase
MFTGIVTETGRVTSIVTTTTGRRLVVEAPATVDGLAEGESVAVNGACLTAIALDGQTVAFDVVQESLDRTNLGDLVAGDRVDLERSMPGSGRFDGHVVQGHVDGVGTVTAIAAEGDARRIRIGLPVGLGRYVVEKGSVAVDGVSLTVTSVAEPGEVQWFEIVLIPHTLAATVLGHRAVGDRVNLEMDVIAKYVERLTGWRHG